MVGTCHIAGSHRATKMPCTVIAIGQTVTAPKKGDPIYEKQVFFNGPFNNTGTESLCVDLLKANTTNNTPTFVFEGRRLWAGSTSGGSIGALAIKNCDYDDIEDEFLSMNMPHTSL